MISEANGACYTIQAVSNLMTKDIVESVLVISSLH